MGKKKFYSNLYKKLYTIRAFETQGVKLYRHGEIYGYYHPCLGQEAIPVGVFAALRDQDYFVSTHRGHGHCIARGADLGKMLAELFARETGYCRGMGGSMHLADIESGNLGAQGIIGAGIPIGVGAALGATIRGEDRMTVVFFSDGAVNTGYFTEGLNLASIWNLPLILVLENNQYASSTPIEAVRRNKEPYRMSEGYGVEAYQLDGNDVLAVYEGMLKAVELCGAGKGPVLIEAKTYRYSGHHVNDPGTYMPKDKLDYYKGHDPVQIGRSYLLEYASEGEVNAIEATVDREIEAAVAFAKNSPEPDVEEFLRAMESYV
ncbi:MAG TPA: thiamine pyrophosphate-dependent dehydrogenase E1 component subunit alpha [Spirochaetia bacterium]|nr:thiamine pyrophosphate-dependent dehydrogenase E1 component subunit alpha [Spirochaetia bacterium]